MKNRNEFSVGEFAVVFGVSRQTLIYYDRIGLFSPARTDPATGYRYYARRQFGEMSFIQMLAGLGVPLAAIRAQRAPIRPDRTEALLERQEAVIGEELRRLRLRESAVRLRLAQIRESRRAEGGVRLVRRAAPVPLFVSAPLDCPREDIPDRVLTDFYTAADRAGLPFGYTLSCLVAAETGRVQRLAFRLAGEDGANGALPAGDCLVLWARGPAGGGEEAYRRLLEEARARGLRPAGEAFEESLLDETTCADPEDFLWRIALPAAEA